MLKEVRGLEVAIGDGADEEEGPPTSRTGAGARWADYAAAVCESMCTELDPSSSEASAQRVSGVNGVNAHGSSPSAGDGLPVHTMSERS